MTTESSDCESGIAHQAMMEKSVPSCRREKEAYKAMNTQPGKVWGNAGSVTRYSGPHADPTTALDTINANQSVTVLCYSNGDTESFTTPGGVHNTSAAWDFVVTSIQDPGGFVPDVYIDTGGPIQNQLPSAEVIALRLQRIVGGLPPAIG